MKESSFRFSEPVPIYFPRPADLPPLVAILIDGDNIQVSEAQLLGILHKAKERGEVVVRRVYGNWAADARSVWKDLILKHAFTPCYHLHSMPRKNATDIALSIATIDLFYLGITTFFLVSSDSDYIPLIQRLRTSNCQVIVVGDPVKNASLIPVCNAFIPLTHTNQEPLVTLPELHNTTSKKTRATEPFNVKQETPGQQKKVSTQVTPSKKKRPIQQARREKKNSSLTTMSVTKNTASVLPTIATPTNAFKPLDDPELTQALKQAFTSTLARGEPVLLVDVVKTLKEQAPFLKPKPYGKNSLLFLVKAKTDLFAFQPIERNGRVIDKMSWKAHSPDD